MASRLVYLEAMLDSSFKPSYIVWQVTIVSLPLGHFQGYVNSASD